MCSGLHAHLAIAAFLPITIYGLLYLDMFANGTSAIMPGG